MRVCYNVVKSINDVLYRQSICYSESISLLVKRLVKGNSIEAKAYKGNFIKVKTCTGQFH